MMHAHLHGGKWSEEEERYAAVLIDAFKAGVLSPEDIEEGTSLRKYLSKKLMCSPKRVSKKYEGTNYNGKQVYFKNRGAVMMQPHERLSLLSKIQILEHGFLKTLSENKASEGLVSRSASLELDMYEQLHLQAISDASNSMLASASAARPHQQASPLAHLQTRSPQGGIGANLLGGLSGGATTGQLGSRMALARQDQGLARMTARLTAGNELSTPSALTMEALSVNPRLLQQVGSSLIREPPAGTTRLQQLEQSLLRNQQMSSIGSTPLVGSAGAGNNLDVMRFAAANRIPTSTLLGRQLGGLDQSMVESYLSDTTQSLMGLSALPAPALSLLERAACQHRQSLGLPLREQWTRSSQFLPTAHTNDSVAKRAGQDTAEPSAKRSRPN